MNYRADWNRVVNSKFLESKELLDQLPRLVPGGEILGRLLLLLLLFLAPLLLLALAGLC
jgi:hypothetical protein